VSAQRLKLLCNQVVFFASYTSIYLMFIEFIEWVSWREYVEMLVKDVVEMEEGMGAESHEELYGISRSDSLTE